jgi:hypothetical protein
MLAIPPVEAHGSRRTPNVERAMIKIQEHIDEWEKRAAETALIADRATDPETRRYNASLARELRDITVKLRSQFA